MGADVYQDWSRTFEVPEDSGYTTQLAIDSEGNIVVAAEGGNRLIFVKYSAVGETLWTASYDCGDSTCGLVKMVLDPQDNILIAAYANLAILTLKYDGSGNMLWTNAFEELQHSQAEAIQADAAGDIIIAGVVTYVTGVKAAYDPAALLIKYDSDGNLLWYVDHNPSAKTDAFTAVAVDSQGNYVAAGYAKGQGGPSDCDYLTAKYDSAGNLLWAETYDGPSHIADQVAALALDSADNVVVTGESFDLEHTFDYLTVKYDPAGHQLWEARYNSWDSWLANDSPTSLAVDGNDNIIVTGEAQPAIGDDNVYINYATVKYDPQGNEQWVAYYNGFGGSDDHYAKDVSTDYEGNIFVTGNSPNGGWLLYGPQVDLATIKYDADGQEIWTMRYSVPSYTVASVHSPVMALDGAGNIYLAGDFCMPADDPEDENGTCINYRVDTVKYVQGSPPDDDAVDDDDEDDDEQTPDDDGSHDSEDGGGDHGCSA